MLVLVLVLVLDFGPARPNRFEDEDEHDIAGGMESSGKFDSEFSQAYDVIE